MEQEGGDGTNCNWHARYNHQTNGTGTERLGNQNTRGVHPNYSIVKIDDNSEKVLKFFGRLAVRRQ